MARAKVFISYRRDDSKYPARDIYRALRQVLPSADVFMDVDSIPLGADFVKILEGWVDKSDIVLALIGPGWAHITDPKTSQKRLHQPDDFVRIEVRRALERSTPVVPVLLDGAAMPPLDELPDDIKGLVRRQAEHIEYRTFDSDVQRLIKRLGLGLPQRGDGCISVDGKILHGVSDTWFKPGNGRSEWFQDCENGPEMVVVPAGSFIMGSPVSEPQREFQTAEGNERPHRVTIARPFSVSRLAITRRQYAAFVSDTGHSTSGGAFLFKDKFQFDANADWRNVGFAQDDTHPVACISWNDAAAYVRWLSKVTSRTYRLLTEAEWEYSARAGSTTPFWWGTSITSGQANYRSDLVPYSGGGVKGEWRKRTVPVDSFEPNPWGLFNVHGNVDEWCEDVWHLTYDGAPTDGSAWLLGGKEGQRLLRGGSWPCVPHFLRAAARSSSSADERANHVGLRVARTLQV